MFDIEFMKERLKNELVGDLRCEQHLRKKVFNIKSFKQVLMTESPMNLPRKKLHIENKCNLAIWF